MENFSADGNILSSFVSDGLPSDFFVDESAIGPRESQPETQFEIDGEEAFPMHRKLLRRRHVRKLQKSKERERQRKEEEERQKELTRDLDRKRRAEKRRSLRQRGKTSQTKSNAKRKLYSTGFKGIENPITLPVPLHGNSYKTGTINHNNNSCNSVLLHYLSSPTSVLGLHRTIVSTPTKYSPQAISHRSNAMMTVLSAGSRSIEMAFPRQASFSLPEFSPVRPTKFRKLQL